MATRSAPGTVSDRSILSLASVVFGAVFVFVGLAGFVVSGDHHAAGQEGGELLGLFQVNVLHNLVHLAAGALMIAAGILGARPARSALLGFGAVYLLLAVLGLFITDSAINVIALNGADNVLHLVLGLALVGTALAGDRARA